MTETKILEKEVIRNKLYEQLAELVIDYADYGFTKEEIKEDLFSCIDACGYNG